MPAVSPTMTAGNIGTWQKEPGDELEDTGGEKAHPKQSPKEEASKSSGLPEGSLGTAQPPMERKESALGPQESDSKGGRPETSPGRGPNVSLSTKTLALEKGVPFEGYQGH
jgi:hypothetical protein